MPRRWCGPALLACWLMLLAAWPHEAASQQGGSPRRPQGQPVAAQQPQDPDFGVSTRHMGLRRRVAMLQWQRDGDGYRTVWSERWIDSTDHAPGHANPYAPSMQNRTWLAERVTLDGYPLDADVVRRLGRWQRFRPGFSRLSRRQAAIFQPEGDGLGSAENPMAPAVGDLRIHWEALQLPPLAGRLNLHEGRWVVVARTRTAAHLAPTSAAAPAGTQESGRPWARWGSWLLFAAAAGLLWRRWRR